MNNKIFWLILGIIVVVLIGWLLFKKQASITESTLNLIESGQVEKTAAMLPRIGSPATPDDIVVDSPAPGNIISSPLSVSGKARGGWYFEASAPVVVIDVQGHELGRGVITAESDWMTSSFVPFSGTISLSQASTTAEGGAVVFLNDNPSGLASTSRYLAVPIYFKN